MDRYNSETTRESEADGDRSEPATDTDVSNEPSADEASGGERASGSRRNFLKASALTGFGALGFGMTGTPARGATSATECNGGSLAVTDEFRLLDNQWGNAEAQQCVRVNDDGTYGWDFDASGTSSGINYPEVFIGTRPWGSDTGVDEFPIRRRNIDELVLDVTAASDISGGEWDWAQEWWLMDEPPSVETRTYQYEVMLLLDWGGGHDHGEPVYTDLWTDRFGNTVDLWALYDSGGTSATFYIFRIQGGHDGGKIDAGRITEWLTTHEGVSEELWLSGSELGNEYWPEAVGETTISEFAVTINGSTYSNRSTDSGSTAPSDSTAPPVPSNLTSPSHDTSSVALAWDPVTDSGSGLAEYVVYADGQAVQRVTSGTTSTVVSGLDAGTTAEFAVAAVDSAGNESDPSNTVSVTTDSQPEPVELRSGAVYRLENANSGLVAALADDSTTDGSTVSQHEWTGATRQRWIARDNGDGTYRLENEHSGKVADVAGASTSDGADVLQWSWHGGANQRWTVRENGDGTYRLENENSEKALAVDGASTTDGANVHQRGWDGGDEQRWAVSQIEADESAPSVPSELTSTSHDRSSVALSWDASTDSGGSGLASYVVYVDGQEDHRVGAETTSTTVSELSSGTSAEFAVTALDGAGNESAPSNTVSVTTDSADTGDDIQAGSVYRLENAASGLAMDVDNAATSDGADVLQWPWHGAGNQRWILRDNGDGTYRLENENSGKVADIDGASTTDGANVLQWGWHGGDNQRWTVHDNGDGTHRLENENSGKVLSVADGSTARGVSVEQSTWTGDDSQRWTLSLADSV